MKLLKITKDGAMHYELDDKRIGVVYESGYVRVSTKRGTNPKLFKYYQINKQLKYKDCTRREMIPNHIDRLKRLVKFNQNNCQPCKN
jgi:hypothetical protein